MCVYSVVCVLYCVCVYYIVCIVCVCYTCVYCVCVMCVCIVCLCYELDRPYDEERHVKMNKLEKEKAIAKIEEAAKKMKQSTYYIIRDIIIIIYYVTEAKERAKGKGREEKDPDKPDTFTEKLAAHLMKNLTVSNGAYCGVGVLIVTPVLHTVIVLHY